MTTTPVERVAEVLQRHYRRVDTPLEIAGLKIDVSDAFVGRDSATDLIVVGDTAQHLPKRLQQTIEGVGRALDMMASRRPLTFVLVGPRPETTEISAMSRFARVLPVGENADDAHLKNWLAVLLPLSLPEPREAYADIAGGLIPKSDDGPLIRALLAKAEDGPAVIAAEFHAALAAPFHDGELDDEEVVEA